MRPFPDTKAWEAVFGCMQKTEMDEWEKEAKDWKRDNESLAYKYEKMVDILFFVGGKVLPKKDIQKEEFTKGMAYLSKWIGSFDPKHEVKTLVCGYILSRIADSVERSKEVPLIKCTPTWWNGRH